MSSKNTSRIPSYRLHKPSGLAVARLNGRDIYLGEHGSPQSRQRYERLIAEWLTNHRQVPTESDPVHAPGGDLTVNELLVAYWEHAQAYYVKNGRPTGELANIRDAMRPLADLYGDTAAAGFGPKSLKAVRQTIIDADLCRTTINARVNRIRRIFKWGVESHLVSATVLHSLQAVAALKKGRCAARESEPVKPVPAAHVEAVFPFVSRQVCAMVQLQLLTGMRPGETTIMRGCDLDTTDKFWVYVPGSHKTEHHGHQRIIYVGPRAQQIIRPFLRSEITGYLFSPKDAMDEFWRKLRASRKTPVTPSQAKRTRRQDPQKTPGEHYTTQSYGYAITKACGKAGVSPWSPNQLRHNTATYLRKEFDIDVARIILGHQSPVVTEIYAERDMAKAAEVMMKTRLSTRAQLNSVRPISPRG